MTLKYLHFIADTKIHEVAIANCVYGGDNDVLDFGVFIPQADPLDGIIPVNPATLSFNLSKAAECKWHDQSKVHALEAMVGLTQYLVAIVVHQSRFMHRTVPSPHALRRWIFSWLPWQEFPHALTKLLSAVWITGAAYWPHQGEGKSCLQLKKSVEKEV